jgi:N-dimethylarginine dimethylaminohydrolase
MSATAERALAPATRAHLRALGFALHTVAMPELEKAGGSLRCCVAEVY